VAATRFTARSNPTDSGLISLCHSCPSWFLELKPQRTQRGLASLSRTQKKSRVTTDHTDSTDKKTDEDWQIALNPP
jgi:hypothetical protein